MKALRPGIACACACVLVAIALIPRTATARGARPLLYPSSLAAATPVTQVMNWFPEPEHGGQYAAVLFGLYRRYKLNLKIQQFNPSVNSGSCLVLAATGRVDFCMDNADSLLEARQQGIPVVAVMTDFDVNPQGIMWHADDASVHGVADLSNHTFIYNFGAGFWDYMKNKYHYVNVKQQNYDFSLRAFYANPRAINQVYVTSEPFTAMQQGHRVKWALIADSGYDPYSQVMVTSEGMLQAHPDVVRAFVRASVEGWNAYFAQPEKVFTYLRTAPGAASYPLSLAAMRFDYRQLRPLVLNRHNAAHGIGWIDPARMTLLKRQMTAVGIKVDRVDVARAYTDRFLP